MRKYLLLALSAFFITTGVLIILNFNQLKPHGYGGLKVTANLQSKIYLDGKLQGTTPFCRCTPENNLKEGEYLLKIAPDDQKIVPFSYRINIEKGVLTVVDRTFLPGSFASAYILSLEKINSKESEIMVISIPDQALVSIDGNTQGVTPYSLKNTASSDHDIELSKDGYNKKTIRIKTIPSYKLIANVLLGTKNENQIGTEQNTPTPTKTASPSASVRINDTPTGFLRVRKEPSLSSDEITRVSPGEIFPYISEQEDWIEIKLKDGKKGWVSSVFAEKITDQ